MNTRFRCSRSRPSRVVPANMAGTWNPSDCIGPDQSTVSRKNIKYFSVSCDFYHGAEGCRTVDLRQMASCCQLAKDCETALDSSRVTHPVRKFSHPLTHSDLPQNLQLFPVVQRGESRSRPRYVSRPTLVCMLACVLRLQFSNRVPRQLCAL